ncbi:MAG: GIY-YIG nuclease family protein [Cyclobacteriaceae bacterium]|nr:GIY-YIG nuclease family protein [Cyclobacteriaceae bacterium]HND42809.1 GIY-YIG nuclease family protein [Cyclobacteriaceae bacterium]HNK25385.1 GIY-YIG nuclease family protein [Cyclobacteriaceae bacterium]
MYYVYILESPAGQWYYGFSENPDKRLSDHNSNRAGFTRFKGPWRLAFRRGFHNKTEALKFEKELKRIKNKKYIRTTFGEYFLT